MKKPPISPGLNDPAYWTIERVFVPEVAASVRAKQDSHKKGPGYAWPVRLSSSDMKAARWVPRYPFTDEFNAEMSREKEWVRMDPPPGLLTAEERSIIEAGQPCPRCSADGYQTRYRGEVTGIRVHVVYCCACVVIKDINRRWLDTKIVPLRFRDIRLDALKPVPAPTSLLPLARQAEVIEILQRNPDGSYLLCGDAGCGKTHFSMALNYHALNRWATNIYQGQHGLQHSVFRFNTKELLDQHVDYERRERGDETKFPDLGVEKIKSLAAYGHRVVVIFDEVEKFNPTQFKMDQLFELVVAVADTKGQLIAISNARIGEIREMWAKYSGTADGILRRFCGEAEGGQMIVFDK
jgi:hypothetical protein